MNTRLLVFATAFAVSSSSLVADETLGRLFFTPEKRQALDYQRQYNIQEKQEAQEDPTLTIDGVVMRSSGRQTVWVNGNAITENDASLNVGVTPAPRKPGHVLIQSGKSISTSAKVGETVHRDTGEAADALNGGRIIVRQPRPPR